MITGYNTDVEHEGVVYHVQTEDKGMETPIVLSLVYSGGAILAAKRAPYDDLISAGFEEATLAERVKRQHRLICAAIHAGRIDELRLLSKPQTDRLVAEAAEPQPTPPTPAAPKAGKKAPDADEFELGPAIHRETVIEPPPAPRPATAEPMPPGLKTPPLAAEPLAAGEELQSTDKPPTGPSPYTVYDPRRRSRLGEVVDEPGGLRITLIGHDPDFHGGESIQLRAIVTLVANGVEEPINGATISVKILGTTFRPVLLSLKTDREGVMSVVTRIPPFTSGRAAIVVKATGRDLSTEARWVVHPGK